MAALILSLQDEIIVTEGRLNKDHPILLVGIFYCHEINFKAIVILSLRDEIIVMEGRPTKDHPILLVG